MNNKMEKKLQKNLPHFSKFGKIAMILQAATVVTTFALVIIIQIEKTSLQEDISQLKQNQAAISSTLKDDQQNNTNKDVNAIAVRIIDLNNTLSHISNTVTVLDQIINSEFQFISTLSEEFFKMKASIVTINSTISQIQQQVSQIDSINTSIKDLNSKFTALNSTISQIQEQTSQIDPLNTQIKTLNSEYTTLNSTISQIQQQASQIDPLNTSVKLLNSQSNSTITSIQRQASQIESINTSINNLNQKQDTSNLKIIQQTQKIDSIFTSVATLNQQDNTLNSTVSQIKQQGDSINSSIHTLNTEYSDLNSSIGKINSNTQSIKQQIDSLKQQFTNNLKSINLFGPYYTKDWEWAFSTTSGKIVSHPSVSATLTINKRSIVTFTVNGHIKTKGIVFCFILQNEVPIPSTVQGYPQIYYYSYYERATDSWISMNYVQEAIIEAGKTLFQVGISNDQTNTVSGRLNGLGLTIKVLEL